MKEELKTEDIIGYLPYRLTSSDNSVNNYGLKSPLIGEVDTYNVMKFIDGSSKAKIRLIPLNSLTKDQLVHFSICFRLWYDKPNFDYKLMIYQDIETCHKLHVDYRGLIEKGLAIKK